MQHKCSDEENRVKENTVLWKIMQINILSPSLFTVCVLSLKTSSNGNVSYIQYGRGKAGKIADESFHSQNVSHSPKVVKDACC